MRGPRRVLFSDVGRRVVPIGKRPALRDQPSVQVLVAGSTDGDDAPVAIDVALLAGDRPLPDVIGQGERRVLAAPIDLAVSLADLARLRRVDPKQPDTLAV